MGPRQLGELREHHGEGTVRLVHSAENVSLRSTFRRKRGVPVESYGARLGGYVGSREPREKSEVAQRCRTQRQQKCERGCGEGKKREETEWA